MSVRNLMCASCLLTGGITTFYGFYSYAQLKNTPTSQDLDHQKKTAIKTIAIGIGLIATGISFFLMSPAVTSQGSIPNYLLPYTEQIEQKTLIKNIAINKFPDYLGKYPSPKEIKVLTLDTFKLLPPGMTLKEVMDHQKVINYQNALQKAQELFLNSPDGCHLEKSFVDSLLEVHRIAFEGSNFYYVNPGKIRLEEVIVYGSHISNKNYDTLKEVFLNNEGKIELLSHFDSLYDRVWGKYSWGFNGLNDLTVNELEVFKKIAYIPPQGIENLEKALQILSKQFQEVCCLIRDDLVNPIPAAAWIHQEIVKIHPFIDGNGRIARIMMNVFLQKGGLNSIIFPMHSKYSIAVEADKSILNGFAKFLLETIKWNREQEVLAQLLPAIGD